MGQVWTEDPFMFEWMTKAGDAFSPGRRAQLQVQAQALAKGQLVRPSRSFPFAVSARSVDAARRLRSLPATVP